MQAWLNVKWLRYFKIVKVLGSWSWGDLKFYRPVQKKKIIRHVFDPLPRVENKSEDFFFHLAKNFLIILKIPIKFPEIFKSQKWYEKSPEISACLSFWNRTWSSQEQWSRTRPKSSQQPLGLHQEFRRQSVLPRNSLRLAGI